MLFARPNRETERPPNFGGCDQRTHLESDGDHERGDHDGAPGGKVRKGVQERREPKVGEDEIMEPVVGRLVHGRRQTPAGKRGISFMQHKFLIEF